jgi:aldose 1-epimerase
LVVQVTATMTSQISSRHYGTTPIGHPVEAWALAGRGGLMLEIITLGGIVTRMLVPDRDGLSSDVVLGFNELESYIASHPYFGAITGRVAGRISGAAFTLHDRTYRLADNNGPNHLHGGICGFDKRIWSATPVTRPDGAPSLRLRYYSPDAEEGYPGAIDIAVIYTVTHDNTFLIETEAVSDQATLLNLTHHSYFNLGGESHSSIADHRLTIFADQFVPAGEHMRLQGRLEPVGPGNDFRCSRRLGEMIPLLFQQHGDLYALRESQAGEMKSAAHCEDPASGRAMTVSTTNSYLQFYTGRFLDGSHIGKSGAAYEQYAGLCLECHGYPDAADARLRNDILLQPGRAQRHATAYAFSVSAEEARPMSRRTRPTPEFS